MSYANMLVSHELLTELLHLPEGTELVDAHAEPNGKYMNFVFYVRHPDIPDGAIQVVPSLFTYYDEDGHVTHIKFEKWNVIK